MAEYIEREKLMAEIYRIGGHNLCGWETIGVKALVERQPNADVVEVRHGKWKEMQGEIGNPFNNQVFDTIDLLVCSICNEIFDVSEARNYCPNCGAKMDGKGEGE